MEWIVLVTLLVAVEYFYLSIMVGKSRGETGIKAPSIIGNDKFERVFRVQQNTLEQLVIFFPALWIFGYYVSATIGAGLGVLFLIGRIIYARGYVKDPDKRAPGFIIGSLSLLALIIGGLVGVTLRLL
ncbi:MAG: MAPEG family protein [Halieaceae bacterium]